MTLSGKLDLLQEALYISKKRAFFSFDKASSGWCLEAG